MSAHDEARESLWALFLGPTIWASHFLMSYTSAAIWCAKRASADIGPLRWTIAAYTIVALLLLALSAHRGFRHHSYGESSGPPHDRDTPEDRHRFLGFASLLLCGLAAVAILYSAMTMLFVGSCR